MNVTWSEFDRYCKELVRQIRGSGWMPDFIMGVPRGGLVAATRLAYLLDVPLTSVILQTTGAKVLLVDDIADSGLTLSRYGLGSSIRIATLHTRHSSSVIPDYTAIMLQNTAWVHYPWEEGAPKDTVSTTRQVTLD